MGEDAAGKNTEEDRNKKWEMAFTARMRLIVPGLFLGNVEASYKREMLQENCIDAIVSLTDARWVWWNTITRDAVPEHRHKWVQCADSSTQDLLAHLSDICEFIDRMASPNLSSLSSFPVEQECKHESNDQPQGASAEAILVHCDLGISRSPTIIIAYLMRKFRMRREDILEYVQSKQKVKPCSNLLANFRFGRMLDIKYGRTKERPSRKHRIKHFWTSALPFWKERGLLDLSHSHLRTLNDHIAAYRLWKSCSNNLRELPLSSITQGLPPADNLRRRAQQLNHDSL